MQEYSVKVTLPDGQVMAVTASESDTLEAIADRFKDYYEEHNPWNCKRQAS